jgi:hypothetical protein
LDFFPTAESGLDGVNLPSFLLGFLSSSMKYIVVLRNRFKTNKNPDENLDLTIDLKNLDSKPTI